MSPLWVHAHRSADQEPPPLRRWSLAAHPSLPRTRRNLEPSQTRHLRALVRQSLLQAYISPPEPWLQTLTDVSLQVAQDVPYMLSLVAAGSLPTASATTTAATAASLAANAPTAPTAPDRRAQSRHAVRVVAQPGGLPGDSGYLPPADTGGAGAAATAAALDGLDSCGQIILRGDERDLAKVTAIAELAVFAACHLKLELALFRDSRVLHEPHAVWQDLSPASGRHQPSTASPAEMPPASPSSALSKWARSKSWLSWLWAADHRQHERQSLLLDADADAAGNPGHSTRADAQSQDMPGGTVDGQSANVFDRAIRQADGAILSVSPFVKFPPPFLLLKLRDQEAQHSASHAQPAMSRSSLDSRSLSARSTANAPSPAETREHRARTSVDFSASKVASPLASPLASPASRDHPKPRRTASADALQSRSSRSSRISADSKAGLGYLIKNNNSLSGVKRHQSISLAFSYMPAGGQSSKIPCYPPELVTIRYYEQDEEGVQDRTLGGYIEFLCSNAPNECFNPNCGHRMGSHDIAYNHNSCCITVRTEQSPSPAEPDRPALLADHEPCSDTDDCIQMWTSCTACGAASEKLPMSIATWHYSFGKYMEMLLYHPSLFPADLCPHAPTSRSLVEHHFQLGSYTVTFAFTLTILYELCIPHFKVDPDFSVRSLMVGSMPLSTAIPPSRDQLLGVRSDVSAFYQSLNTYAAHLAVLIKSAPAPKSSLSLQSLPLFSPSQSSLSGGGGGRGTDDRLDELLSDMQHTFQDEEQQLVDSIAVALDLNHWRRRCLDQMRDRIKSVETLHKEYFGLYPLSRSWALPEYSNNPLLHIIPSSSVVVREDEPGSIIAFTLSSRPFIEFMARSAKQQDTLSLSGQETQPRSADDQQPWTSLGSEFKYRIKWSSHHAPSESRVSSSQHVQYQFADARTSFSCTVYFAKEFHELRRMCGMGEQFVWSLARSSGWNASGGKSKASFFKTKDDRFIMKELASKWTVDEKDALFQFAPLYFEYVRGTDKQPSILAKILGFFTIKKKNLATGQSVVLDVLVMEHLFAGMTVTRKFDLKGVPDRHVKTKGKSLQPGDEDDGRVMWDGDWNAGLYKQLFRLHAHSKHILMESVTNDARFLAKANIMDYSLLVGVNDAKKELIVGIVDYIGPFTWFKQLETQGKSTLQSTLLRSSKEVTVLPPAKYRDRFCKAMEQNFLMVPDKWLDVPLPRTSLPPVV
ncbi:hypothetical protein BC831DRAFT_484979 [Entophlyctis helioformis]|nr:hypothetical protein BC831DRAFT_484979 [Entophlyctis helioformis]